MVKEMIPLRPQMSAKLPNKKEPIAIPMIKNKYDITCQSKYKNLIEIYTYVPKDCVALNIMISFFSNFKSHTIKRDTTKTTREAIASTNVQTPHNPTIK